MVICRSDYPQICLLVIVLPVIVLWTRLVLSGFWHANYFSHWFSLYIYILMLWKYEIPDVLHCFPPLFLWIYSIHCQVSIQESGIGGLNHGLTAIMEKKHTQKHNWASKTTKCTSVDFPSSTILVLFTQNQLEYK